MTPMVIDKSLLNVESVKVKIQELQSKYIDSLDYLLSFEYIKDTMSVDNTPEQVVNQQEDKRKQMRTVFEDLSAKYDHFAKIAGIKSEPDLRIIEDIGGKGLDTVIGVRLDMIDKNMLAVKIANLEANLVECEAFFFSYPSIIAHNDTKKDKENIEELEKELKKTELTANNLIEKIKLLKSF